MYAWLDRADIRISGGDGQVLPTPDAIPHRPLIRIALLLLLLQLPGTMLPL